MHISEAAQERVRELYEKNKVVTAEMVVEDAKNEGSPLHHLFEWDDEKAAGLYRLERAREVIRSIPYTLIRDGRTTQVISYVHITGQKPGYHHVEQIKTNRDLAIESLVQECQGLASVLRRVKELAWVFELETEVDEMMRQAGVVQQIVRLRSGKVKPPAQTIGKKVARRQP